jgi:hypothetical protein
MEAQSTTNRQGNTVQKEQCWWYYNTHIQTILQSNSKINKQQQQKPQHGTSTKTDMKTNGTK